MKKYVDGKQGKLEEYKVENLLLLSIRYLKFQMMRQRMEISIERFVDYYKIKNTVLKNLVESELLD